MKYPKKYSEYKECYSPLRIKESQKEKLLAKDFDTNETQESKVGKKLSTLTMKRVIILVLLLLLVIPLFESEYYFDDDKSFIFGLNFIVNVSKDPKVTLKELRQSYEDYLEINKNSDFPLIFTYIHVSNKNFLKNFSPVDLGLYRKDEIEDFIYNEENNSFKSIIDLTKRTKLNAGLNLFRTIFVCFVLAISSLYFSKDLNELALRPIEKMIEKVDFIAKNPLQSRDQHLIIEKDEKGTINEAKMIYNSIIRIGYIKKNIIFF